MNENENSLNIPLQPKKKPLMPAYIQKRILNKNINKCICKIQYTQKEKNCSGTGFFCKIPNIDMICLFTNRHVIDASTLERNTIIELTIDDNTFKPIEFSGKRFIYTCPKEDLDFTFIEILEQDEINNYLEIDNDILSKNFKYYNKKKYIHYNILKANF